MSEPLRCDQPAHTDHAQLYELLVSELTDFAVFLTDPEGCIASWNPGVERILGYGEAEWVGRPIHIIFTPQDRAARKPEEEMGKAARDGRSPDIRWHQRKDGSRLFVEGTLVALKDGDGQLLGFSKVMRDVTAHQQAEEARQKTEMALAERERRYHALFTSIDQGFCLCEMVWDEAGRPADYRFLELNPKFEEATGLTRELALSGTAREIVPGLEDFWVERYGQVVLSGKPERFESHSSVMGRFFDVYAQPVGHSRFALVFSDITARKEAEAERERLHRQIEAERQRLHQVFAQAPVAVVVFRGPEFVIELANPPYRSLLQGRELVGRRFREVVPELGQEVWDVFHRVLHMGETITANEWLIPYDSNQDGVREDHWFNAVYHPLRELDGSVSSFVAVLTDVTTQVLVRQALERVNRGLEEFAHVASHDLQEPLRMVHSYSQLLARRLGTDLTDEQREFVGFIQHGVRRMEQLIQDLLAYSRTVHTPSDLATSHVALEEALGHALMTVDTRVAENGAIVTHDPLPTVRGDQMQLAHVFQNLLSNALKYRKLEERPRVQISAVRQGDVWMVSVRDNGIGFDPRHAERIFGLFKRLHGDDEYPGTGLGLAICQRIIERYGGRMWAESEPGKGSTFFFTLPAAP